MITNLLKRFIHCIALLSLLVILTYMIMNDFSLTQIFLVSIVAWILNTIIFHKCMKLESDFNKELEKKIK